MNYNLMPSLKHIALVKIAVSLWNQDDIRSLIAKHYSLLNYWNEAVAWQEIEDKVLGKLPQLPLPNPLKNCVLGVVKPIGIQINAWMKYHSGIKNGFKNLPSEFCWTPLGTINKKGTAEILLEDERIDIACRYEMACIYCLQDHVPKLWNIMCDDVRKCFYSEDDPWEVQQQFLVVFWTYYVKEEVFKIFSRTGEIPSDCSPYKYAFRYSAGCGNKAGTEYFFKKLTIKEREVTMVPSAKTAALVASFSHHNEQAMKKFCKEHYADVVCFLLSQMNKEQQMMVLQSNPHAILGCLLEWPYQSMFLETASCVWNSLESIYFYILLNKIVDKVTDGYKDFDYEELFAKFWQQSPYNYKIYAIDICADGWLLAKIFQMIDMNNIQMMLNEAKERGEVAFRSQITDVSANLIHNDQWHIHKLFIQACLASKAHFKKDFHQQIKTIDFVRKRQKKYISLFQVLSDFIDGCRKRRNDGEGESSNPSKKTRSN